MELQTIQLTIADGTPGTRFDLNPLAIVAVVPEDTIGAKVYVTNSKRNFFLVKESRQEIAKLLYRLYRGSVR